MPCPPRSAARSAGQGKALEVTKQTLKRISMLKAKRAEREARELNEAEELSRKINKLKITMELETGETGKAFGSITATDLAERISKELGGKVELDRHKIQLDKPIKEGGVQKIGSPSLRPVFSIGLLSVLMPGLPRYAVTAAPSSCSPL